MKMSLAIVACLLCVSAQSAERVAGPPSTNEVLRILSGANPQTLVNVLVAPNKRQKGAWDVQADTQAKPSATAGICEARRAFATVSPLASSAMRWGSNGLFHIRAVSVRDASTTCEGLAADDLFEVTDSVRLEDVRTIKKAVEQIHPCARQSKCTVRLLGTPWAILDAIADAPHAPRIRVIDYDPNLSTPSSSIYDVSLIFTAPRPSYRAIVTVSNGDIVQVQIVEVVP